MVSSPRSEEEDGIVDREVAASRKSFVQSIERALKIVEPAFDWIFCVTDEDERRDHVCDGTNAMAPKLVKASIERRNWPIILDLWRIDGMVQYSTHYHTIPSVNG